MPGQPRSATHRTAVPRASQRPLAPPHWSIVPIWVLLALIFNVGAAQADDKPDPRDVFGLGKKHTDDKHTDPRDVFGLGKKHTDEAPLDCSEGLVFGCALATDPLADPVPYALSTWLPASYLLGLPVADATHDAVAHYALGASRDEAGVFFAGANGLENRWTVDGAPADNPRTGGVDTRVPLVFLDGLFVTAGGFAARDRTSTGGTIDARLRRGTEHHELEVRAFGSWNTSGRHRPILPATYTVRNVIADGGPDGSASLVATGPLGSVFGGHAWYVAGIAPSLHAVDFTWTAARLVDRDHDMVPDGLPGVVDTEGTQIDKRRAWTWAVPAMARLGLDRGPHHLELTLIGTANNEVYSLANATLQAGAVDRTSFVGDAIATWRGTWHDTRARVQLAWHRSTRSDSAHDPAAANIPQVLTAYVPATLSEDPTLAALCADEVASDPYPGMTNCPVPSGWFASGGAGALVDSTADRPSITADVAHRFGVNVLRAGVTGEDTRLVTETHFTGGEQIRSLFPGHMSERRFIDAATACPSDPMLPCTYVDRSVLSFRTRYTAAYIEDTWAAASNISVDGGLRWELMWVGPALHFSNELAPRLGITWDPIGNGRSRVWTSMGRNFAMLPAGLGATILPGARIADDITSSFGKGRAIDTGLPLRVVPGVEPLAQDELTLGAEFALARAVSIKTWLQGRWLRRGLDTTVDGFDNPGRNGDIPATRDTGLFAFELATAPTAQLALRMGYLYGQTIGTWTGAFDPRQGAVLYAGSDYDVRPINALGPLPTDIGHRFFLEAERRGTLGSVNLAVTTRLTVGSGRPRNVLASTDLGIEYLIPRGSAGRNPLVTQANVRLAAKIRTFDLTLDVFNLFDRREPTNLDELYTIGPVSPIDGGSLEDLVFLKTSGGTAPTRRAGFSVPAAYQTPLSVTLGIHRAF
ncbi:MAG: hypothetical protein JWO36_1104 [Myxococcales bacterium]|nr:hypothetical protein [Myxococcales bacterium]